eukprot:scaffold4140_cov149-Amphora_coffeaeformis.AAC.3
MVAGLKFLSKKSFNPQNLSNQKKVWEREQRQKTEERRIKEREEQLRRERDDEELRRARGDHVKLNFMYQAPPGSEATGKKELSPPDVPSSAAASSKDVTQRQPGDDDAAAAFRAMLAGGVPPPDETTDKIPDDSDARGIIRGTAPGAFGTVLQGSSYDKMAKRGDEKQPPTPETRSALEKAVGRRQQGNNLTLDEQIERFPALANAPRQRGVQVGVSFKPLGTQIRNVRCLVCGIWGHSKGDRECKMSGWDPFSTSLPTTSVAAASAATSNDDVEKRHRSKRRSSCDSNSDDDSDDDRSDDGGSRRCKKKHRKRSYVESSDESSYRRRKKHRRKKKKKKHRRHDREESSPSRKRRHRSASREGDSR